jgi:flagellar assembly protein FliH
MSSLPFAAFGESAGFQSDLRFSAVTPAAPKPGDPIAQAWTEGHAAGLSEAREAAEAQAETEAAARAKITITLARLDADQIELLRQRLTATVAALCEASLAPLALDPTAMAARVSVAASMLARADDDKVLRLHPDDLALVSKQLPEDLEVFADPALERGALRLETANGGVEDGPSHWRRAIAEALAQC